MIEDRPRDGQSRPVWDAAIPSGLGRLAASVAALLLRGAAWAGLLATAALCVVPVLVILAGGFSEGNPFSNFHPSTAPWSRALGSAQTLQSIGYSLLLSLRVPAALAIAFPVAWYLARNDVFGKRTIMYVLWLAFFLPILPATLGWILLLDPDHGIVNGWARSHIGTDVMNIYSLWGITWMHLTLSTVPIMVILIEPAQRLIDASYEEAATIAGAKTWTTLRRITLPLLAPTLLTALIAALIKALEAFEVEQLLGVPAGIQVYSTRVYNLIGFDPPDRPQALALSSLFLALLFVLVVLYRGFLHRARMTATLTGKGARLMPRRRTPFSAAVSALLFAALAITVLLPFAAVAASSLSRLFGFYNLPHPWTLAHWRTLLASPAFASALQQSILIGGAVMTGGTLLYLALAWFLARNDFRGKSALSLAIWLPWAVPGVLLGTAFLSLFLNVPGLRVIHGTVLALIIVLVVQTLPFATHLFEASIGQIARELEEAALMSGAGPLRAASRITAPLIAPMVASVMVVAFMSAMKDISATVLLATPATQTLPLLMFGYATSGQLEDAAVVGVITVVIAMAMAMLATLVGDRSAVAAHPRR